MDPLDTKLRSIEAPQVLDVATGRGNFAGFLRDEYRGMGVITGIDFDWQVLGKSGKFHKDIDNFLPVCMNSSEIAFPAETFDMVCISNSLHHLTELTATLEEMKRVLRSGGFFLVNEMYCDDQTESQMTHVLMHEWWASIDMQLGTPHFSTFPKAGILRLCEELGLDELITSDYSSLQSDPKDKEVLNHVNGAIDMYLSKAENISNNSDLVERGEELRERLLRTGFHGATSLTALGRK